MAEYRRCKIKLLPATLAFALLTPAGAVAQTPAADAVLPEIKVQDRAERADGPVDGYRATRSSTATKTDTPLKDVPGSVTVVPAQLIKDQAMESMGDVFRYVPGVSCIRAKAIAIN